MIKHSGKATKKRIIAIDTDQNENRMKVSAKPVFTSAITDDLWSVEISTTCRLSMGVKIGQTFTRGNAASHTCHLLP